MAIEFDEIAAPADWASALVNGDYSGLDDAEAEACRAFVKEILPWRVVDVARNEDGEANDPRFTWRFDLYGGTRYRELFPEVRGGSVLDYVVHKRA